MTPSTIKPFQIFDSRTGQSVLIKQGEEVSIYLCGPTLYNDLHIGNVRNIIVFAALKNVLSASGYTVRFVQNLTDIGEKIVAKAKESHQTEQAVANAHYEKYIALLNQLNIPEPTLIRVSAVVPQIIAFIQKLEKANLTIKKEDGVYFDLSKCIDEYGIFKNIFLKTKNSLPGDLDFHQANFALWKLHAPDQVAQTWDSPWGPGRPGWHTECILLATNYGSTKATIHGGGKDLIFPHHENERIQFFALNKQEPVDIWFHNGFVNTQKSKISKSAAGYSATFLAKEMIEHYSANVIKFWILGQNPRLDMEVNHPQLKHAANMIEKITRSVTIAHTNILAATNQLKTKSLPNSKELIDFINALTNNIDTPKALELIAESLKQLNKFIVAQSWNQALANATTICECLRLLGITISPPEFDSAAKKLILSWTKARAENNFQLADQLRAELIKKKFL